jgi:hypothetical protein
MNFRLFVQRHFDAGKNQENSENIHDPTEGIEEGDTGKDKDRSGNQRQQYSPEQGLVFIGLRHAEKPEYQHEDKKIVDTQRIFNDISGEKLHRLGMTVTMKKVNTRAEQDCQRHPESRPKQGFLHFDDVNLAVENTEV